MYYIYYYELQIWLKLCTRSKKLLKTLKNDLKLKLVFHTKIKPIFDQNLKNLKKPIQKSFF